MPVPKSAKRKVTPAKWQEIEQAWKDGKYATVADLSAHFKIPENQIRTRFLEQKIRRGSNIQDYNEKVQKELDEKARESAKLIAKRIEETREEHYKFASGITKLTYAEILTAKQGGMPLSSVKQNLSSLESAMKIMKMAREERFAVLGVHDEKAEEEENLPELLVTELSPEQIEQMRSQDAATDEDMGLDADVVIMGESIDTSEEPVDEEDE